MGRAWLVVSLLACACTARTLGGGPDAGVLQPQSGAPGAAAPGAAADDGGASGPIEPPPTITSCPPGDAGDLSPSPPRQPVALSLPASCALLPETVIFPSAPAPSGRFTRCASFKIGAVTALGASPDGRLVAMVTGDGIARVVEVNSRRVVALLAPPRAMVDFALFAPDGGSVLTLSRAQREATLWRTADWTPVWTTSLPGPRNYLLFGGGAAFAPDGRTAVVSPGSDTFLLDVATGAVRARRSSSTWIAVMDPAYGWGGRRVVVTQPRMAGSCVRTPNGGQVVLLDPETLEDIAVIADVPNNTGWQVPGFRASPTDDLVLVASGPTASPGLQAFKLSDGGALPAPAIGALPAAFLPDGASVLISAGGALGQTRLADGATLSVAMIGTSGPVAMSADGSLVAIGGQGGDLLRTWRPGAPAALPLCGALPVATTSRMALSADGLHVALGSGSSVRVVRTDDGGEAAPIVVDPAKAAAGVALSPAGDLVLATATPWPQPYALFRVSDGARILLRAADELSGVIATFQFSPRGDRLYEASVHGGQSTLETIRLDAAPTGDFAGAPYGARVIGVSAGCPVLSGQSGDVWRACPFCGDTPVTLGGPMPVLSSDGELLATAGEDGTGVTLWRMRPAAAPMMTVGRRVDLEHGWYPYEFPVAIAPGGARLLTGADPRQSCYAGPAFDVNVWDTTTGALVDTLPPGVNAVDAGVRAAVVGTQLWCIR